MAKNPPAFQCYASNIIADKRYRLMVPIERCIWISIYLECWPNRAVPADPAELAKYLGYSVGDIRAGLTDRVLSFFHEVHGELVSPELEEYRSTLEERNKLKSEGGKEGARRKLDKTLKRKGTPKGFPEGFPKGLPEGLPEGSLIQSKPNQTSQTQSPVKGIVPVVDSGADTWVNDYDSYLKASKG